MTSQHLYTSTPQLDAYLNGIKEAFDRLNHELREAREQKDKYQANYRSQAKELQELQQTVFRRDSIVCQYCKGEIPHASRVPEDSSFPPISPISSSSEYYSQLEEEDTTSDRLGNTENSKQTRRLDSQQEGSEERGDVQERIGSKEQRAEPTPGITSLSSDSDVTSVNEPGDSTWDVESNGNTDTLNLNLVHTLTQKGTIFATFSMDGKYLATGSSIGVVSIFEVETGARISVMRDLLVPKKDLPSYRCLGFSPNSKYLATGESDGKVRIWIISQRRVRNTFRHRKAVNALDFSPNGRCIVTCSDDRTVRIWRLRDGFSRVLAGFQYEAWAVRFSADGRYVATGDFFRWMLIRSVRTGQLVAKWRGHSNPVASLVFTPDGKSLLSASWDKTVIKWDFSSINSIGMTEPANAMVRTNPTGSGLMEISRLVGHTDRVHAVSISPDGKWIASGSGDRTVRIWNAHDASSECILSFAADIRSVDISPVGNYIAIGGRLGYVEIWNYEM